MMFAKTLLLHFLNIKAFYILYSVQYSTLCDASVVQYNNLLLKPNTLFDVNGVFFC